MMAELTLEDAAKVLNEHEHPGHPWTPVGDGVFDGLQDEFEDTRLLLLEARAIAREYLRLDGKLPGPATRAVIADALGRARVFVESDPSYAGEIVVGVRISDPKAFIAEREMD